MALSELARMYLLREPSSDSTLLDRELDALGLLERLARKKKSIINRSLLTLSPPVVKTQ
jgi:hypothetical protein